MDYTPKQNQSLIANPYIVGRPLTEATASLFFGRGEVFGWLEENLTATSQSNALMLYGRRRIGKTSTLYQLVEGERGQRLRENPARPYRAAYIDLQRYAGRSTDEWLRRITRDISSRIATSAVTQADANDGESAYDAFDRVLDQLELEAVEKGATIIAFDEFEQIRAGIGGGALDPDVIPFLRSQIQHRRHVTFLVCGSYGLLDAYWNPIVNLMSRHELAVLNKDESALLVRVPLEGRIAYQDEAVDLIWRYSAGHPFLIQTICHRLVNLLNQQRRQGPIQAADVEQVTSALDQEGFVHNWLGDDLPGWRYHPPSAPLEIFS